MSIVAGSWRTANRSVGGVAALVVALASLAQARYGGGSGTIEDPYQIWTAEQLNTIGIDPNDLFMNFKLMADIDLAVYQADSFHLIGCYDASHRMVCLDPCTQFSPPFGWVTQRGMKENFWMRWL